MLRSLIFKDTELNGALATIAAHPLTDQETLFVAVGANSSFELNDLLAGLDQHVKHYFGGVFPGIIRGGRRYDRGFVISRVPCACKPQIIEAVSGGNSRIPPALPETAQQCDKLTAMVLVDGLSAGLTPFLERLHAALDGRQMTFLGGGAGRLDMKQAPCVFTQDGLFMDAAAVALVPRASLLGIRHGWEKLEGPFTATRTTGNLLIQMDGQDAFSVYRKIVESAAGKAFNMHDFYTLSSRYPLGIERDGGLMVRDPLKLDDEGHLVCCGDIPEGAALHILKGDPAKLIAAADEAARACLSRAFSANVTHAFVIDCVSRMMFLRDLFERELDVINRQLAIAVSGPEPLGFLSLGEIASDSRAAPLLYNKTTVLSMLLE